jgi:DNA-directed RNA polymerase subunit alpha
MILAERSMDVSKVPQMSGELVARPVGGAPTRITGSRAWEVNAMRIRWRGLELPSRVLRDEVAGTPTYGKFTVEPFERGFGTTVGNSLRRILLSSLEGAAVTHVKIKGADHEFTSLPGVVEDATVIILNVKSLIVRLNSESPKTMRVTVRGKAKGSVDVRAENIQADPAIEIINKDQLLCTLTEDVEFDMEMTVAHGRSYATADENKPDEQDQIIGIIAVDSVFSPVTRVRYRVEDTRVGQRTNYDRLVMEIWTNGTVTPEMALVEAAKILRKHLNPFVQYFELGTGLGIEAGDNEGGMGGGDGGSADASIMSMPIAKLDLSVRSSNCLTSANISTVGQLIQMDEPTLLKLRSFGKTSLREVKRKLADQGLSLKPNPDGTSLDLGDDDDDVNDGDFGQTYGGTSMGTDAVNPMGGFPPQASPPDSAATNHGYPSNQGYQG